MMIALSGARRSIAAGVFGLLLLLGIAIAQTDTAASAAPGQSYAVLIGGIGGDGPYGKWYADWLPRFQTYLTTTAHVPTAHITSLLGDNATTEAISAAIAKFATTAQPQDQLILFIVGHGENKGDAPRLTLAGPDLEPGQLADMLKSFPARNQVILNFSASSGDFLKTLSAPGRVNLAATSPTETNEPVFAEFFLRGLESKRADTDHNGTINLLEAFNWAAQQTPLWIVRWTKIIPPKSPGPATTPAPISDDTIWKASGKETVEIFEKLYSGLPTRKLDPRSDRTAADADVPIFPPGGQVTADWDNRRAINEHATLEDSGAGVGFAVIGDKGLQPIIGQNPGDPGYLAAHTILGQPTASAP